MARSGGFTKKLYRLSELDDFEVAKGYEDIRGWEVISGDNKSIGKVDELIVDPISKKVRYIDVAVSEEIKGLDEYGHILLPIGAAALDSKKDIVYAGGVATVTLLKYPKFEGEVSQEYESSVRDLLGEKADHKEGNFYESDLYDDKRFNSSRKQRLYRLNELKDQKIMNTDPDVRGWDVVSQDGLKLGTVDELIADPEKKKVRYLDIAVDAEDETVDHNILIPIGMAALDTKDDKVIVKLNRDTLLKLPVYNGKNITREYENSFRETARLETMTTADPDDDEYYSNEYFNDQGFYGARGKGVRWM